MNWYRNLVRIPLNRLSNPNISFHWLTQCSRSLQAYQRSEINWPYEGTMRLPNWCSVRLFYSFFRVKISVHHTNIFSHLCACFTTIHFPLAQHLMWNINMIAIDPLVGYTASITSRRHCLRLPEIHLSSPYNLSRCSPSLSTPLCQALLWGPTQLDSTT